MKNRLIVFERAIAANARKTMIVGAGRRAQRYLTAVEFVLLFTPRLVGKNAGVHPAARGIVPLLRSAYPQSAATMGWWVFLDGDDPDDVLRRMVEAIEQRAERAHDVTGE